MELIYNLFTIIAHHFSFLGWVFFYYKFSFIFLLFLINLYLIFIFNNYPEIKRVHPKNFDNYYTKNYSGSLTNSKELPILQAGFNVQNLKSFITYLGTIGGLLSAAITIKNEIRDIQIGKLDQLAKEERDGIRRSIDKNREEHQTLLNSLDSHRNELYNLHIEKAKIFGHNDRLLSLHNNMKNNILSFKEKSIDPTAKLSELGILEQLIQQDASKFSQELESLILNIENPSFGNTEDSNSKVSLKESEINATEYLKDIKETHIFDFNILTSIDWFEGLNGIKKLSVCLILGKGVIFSALTSIIFIFYGNILIKKYDLENKYPKLAIFIQLRQKFQKYYFNYYCFLILLVVVSEIIFSLAVLTF